MLKPLETEFKGRKIALECTHKRSFPPPQMYGSTPEDIDNLWRQGRVDQAQYQHLKTWHEACGLMIMGPKCLDCPLALKQNPRPGRPHVIETEAWLPAKERMHWDDMAAGKTPLETPPSTVPDKKPLEGGETVEHEDPQPSPEDALAQGNTGVSTVEMPEEEPEPDETPERPEPDDEAPEDDAPEPALDESIVEAPALDESIVEALADD